MRRLNNCYICGDLNRDIGSSGIAMLMGRSCLDNAILWENDLIALLPAPGAFCKRYYIVATKSHVSKFSGCTASTLISVKALFDAIQCLNKNETYVLFEHGGRNGKGGACVDHAHLHLLPVPRLDLLERELLSRYIAINVKITSLNQFDDDHYIYLLDSENSFYFRKQSVELQEVRKIVSQQYGKGGKWDWTRYPFKENFLSTIDDFNRTKDEFINTFLNCQKFDVV